MQPIARVVLGTLAAIGALSACGGQESALTEASSRLPAAAVGSHLVFVETDRAEALLVDVGEDAGTPGRRLQLPPTPRRARPRNGETDELLVLCSSAGEDDGGGDATLAAIEVGDEPSVRRYPLPAPFNAMQQSEDGRHLFLYFDEDRASERLLFNPNQVAFIDLTEAPDETNPRLRSLRSFGEAPNGVFYSPPLTIGGEERRLAVVNADTYVSIFDLGHPERDETTVPLTSLNDGRPVAVEQVLFDTDPSWVYVRGAQAQDIFVLPLEAKTGDIEQGSNDFRVASINQLGVGRQPSDMKLFTATTGNTADPRQRLLAVAQGRLAIIDPRSSRVTDIPIDSDLRRALLFGTMDDSGDSRPQALLYSDGGAGRSVAFVDLDGIEARRSRNIERFAFDAGIARMIPRPQNQVVSLVHARGGSGGPAMSLLNLEERTVAPIESAFSLTSSVLDAHTRKLWVAVPGQTRLAFLELEGFHTGQVTLDAPIERLIPMSEATGRVAVLHPGSDGYVTLIDATEPARSTARSARGFFLEGLLERGEQ